MILDTRLDFDYFEGDRAWVCQAMSFAKGDVGGLIFGEQQFFVAAGDFGLTANDHPVLGTVVVLLQAEAGTRLDLDTLDLEAPTFVDAVVPAPGAVDLAVQGLLLSLGSLQLCDYVLDILAARFVGHQNGVGRFDDDEVFHTDQGDQPAGAMAAHAGRLHAGKTPAG
jgi:hypothetical protein